MASDMEVRTKQRCVTEFLHVETFPPIDIHQRLINVYGDQTVDVSTVMLWVMHCSSDPAQLSAQQRKSADYD
jgi:hypothetical protein